MDLKNRIRKKGSSTVNIHKTMNENYDEENHVTTPLSASIDINVQNFEQLFTDSGDLVKRKFPIGKERKIWAYIAYIDVMIDRRVIEESILEQLIVQVRQAPPTLDKNIHSIFDFVRDGGLATADIKELKNMDEVTLAVLSGDTILFIDGFNTALMIATKGWPNRGVQEPDTEAVVRGPKEGFSETFRFNTVLIRRRIRDTKLKLKQYQLGTRSRTDVGLMYMEGIVRPEILEEVKKRIHSFQIDAVLESGIVEQLIEDEWYSPFPQIQVTQRPDKAASAILEGRIAIIVDTTPFVLLVPTTINCFFQSSEDYYHRWQVMSFIRILRYCAAFLSVALPGLYIALTTFHPSMIPTALTFSIAASREGVPFPAVIEVVIMELAFELLREAGVRLPGPIGNTIGIVGGLIIGQAAVEANLISPIIVIIVALTAISSFIVPSSSFTEGIRTTKYIIIILSAFLGLYGFVLSVLIILIHLISLASFGQPYLAPYVGRNDTNTMDLKDSIIRVPTLYMKRRPVFARADQRIRMRRNSRRK